MQWLVYLCTLISVKKIITRTCELARWLGFLLLFCAARGDCRNCMESTYILCVSFLPLSSLSVGFLTCVRSMGSLSLLPCYLFFFFLAEREREEWGVVVQCEREGEEREMGAGCGLPRVEPVFGSLRVFHLLYRVFVNTWIYTKGSFLSVSRVCVFMRRGVDRGRSRPNMVMLK